MASNRRAFLGSLLAGTASAAAAAGAVPRGEVADSFLFREQDKKGFSILQGMTDETSAQFSVVLPKLDAWTITVTRADGLSSPGEIHQFATSPTLAIEIVSRKFSGLAVHKVAVDGLQLGVLYLLRVRDARGVLRDEREFAALDLNPRRVRLAFVSCMLDLLHRDDIWHRLEAQKPEAVLFLGDNVYADRTSFINKNPADEKQLWERYVLTRQRVLFYFQRRLRPVLATWDDHDFGADNAYRDFPAAAASLITFETFFAQSPRPSLAAGPGIARRWSAFGADFVFLDGRSFRDPGVSPNAKIFGDEQERWLLSGGAGVVTSGPSAAGVATGGPEPAEALAQAGRPTWLLTGSVFFGAYQSGESFEGSYAQNFRDFLAALGASSALYCFVSGDVHYSEVMDIEADRLGYPTFELITSAMHSYSFPGHEHRFYNSRRRVSTGSHNFVIFEGSFNAGHLKGELTAHSANRADFRTLVEVTR